ncbi:multimerin-1 [Ctenodactylus gundi]
MTYVHRGTGPCGSCPQRSQTMPSPVYRMQHKTVTSLEWRCCPGYSGPNCQMKAQEQQQLVRSPQAESHTVADGRAAEQAQPQRQQDCSDSAVMQKMVDQINRQAAQLAFLQKRVDNFSLAVDDVRRTFSSLEEKISDDQGWESQSLLKGLKPKNIHDLVKDIVREHLKVFQNDIEETVAQLFKTVSGLSKDLDTTRQEIQQVNQSVASAASQQKSVLVRENGATVTTMADLQSRILSIRRDLTSRCEEPIRELGARQAQLEGTVQQEQARAVLYHESFNATLTKMKEVHRQLSSTELASDGGNAASSNATGSLSALREKVSKQGVMLLQLLDDLHLQDSKISNLTVQVQRAATGDCEATSSMCTKDWRDWQLRLKDAEENVQVLNQTLAEVVFPMDSRMDKMGEQLSDLLYDMEILQPLLERGTSLGQLVTPQQPKEAEVMRKKVENLMAAVNSLNVLMKELTKRHNLLRNEVLSRGDAFERRLNDFALGMEDGLNKTVTILNHAVDFVQDNYVSKATLPALQHDAQAHHQCHQNMEAILTSIPQFQHLNDSIRRLASDDQRYNLVLQVAKALAGVPKGEELGQSSFQKVYRMFNETSSQLVEYQENVSRLEKNMLSATEISEAFETRLQGVESKVSQVLIPSYISLKKGLTTNERDQAIQLQVLSSRFKALETKSIYLSINFSSLNKTVHDVLAMCQNASTRASDLRAAMPGSPQEGLAESVGPIIEIKTQAVLSNLTQYIDRLWSDSLTNLVTSQKQVKVLKKPSTLKKPAVSLSTVVVGRVGRNTDDAAYHVTAAASACRSQPCQNGGTCVDGQARFICACRHPFSGDTCTVRLAEEDAPAPDFSKGSYRYAPMVAFFVSHTYGMTTPGPILFNDLDVNYGASYNPRTGRFRAPHLGVYVFKYTIESFSAHISGFLVVDGRDKLAFESENINSEVHCDRVLTGDALLELNYGQEVWLRLVKGTIPAKFPPVTTFSGYLLYRT